MNPLEISADGAVSVNAACRFLSVSRSTLYGLMRTGKLPYSTLNSRRVVPLRALRVLLAETMSGADLTPSAV